MRVYVLHAEFMHQHVINLSYERVLVIGRMLEREATQKGHGTSINLRESQSMRIYFHQV